MLRNAPCAMAAVKENWLAAKVVTNASGLGSGAEDALLLRNYRYVAKIGGKSVIRRMRTIGCGKRDRNAEPRDMHMRNRIRDLKPQNVRGIRVAEVTIIVVMVPGHSLCRRPMIVRLVAARMTVLYRRDASTTNHDGHRQKQ